MNLRKLLALAMAVPMAVAAASAGAQTMKPGLWEMTNKMGGSPEMDQAMVQLQQQMANMPPEQRKMMEGMMAKKGMGMGGASFRFHAKHGRPVQRHASPETAQQKGRRKRRPFRASL